MFLSKLSYIYEVTNTSLMRQFVEFGQFYNRTFKHVFSLNFIILFQIIYFLFLRAQLFMNQLVTEVFNQVRLGVYF